MATKPAKKAAPVKKAIGRPSSYTKKVGDIICERLADGESLRSICSEDKMPRKTTVFRWLKSNAAFRDQYARARELQADGFVDEIIEIADEECIYVRKLDGKAADPDDPEDVLLEATFDKTAVMRNKLRIDARKWVASKLRPKVYGERTNPDQKDDDTPVQPVKVVVQVKDARADDANA